MMKRILGILVMTACACGPQPPPNTACSGRKEGDLVITELMIDPDGTDTGNEWIEIFNTLNTPVDLKGITVSIRDTDGSGAKSHVIRAGTVPAKGYFVLGDVRSGPNPTWLNYSYSDALGTMGNSRGVVSLRCGTTPISETTYPTAAKPQRSRMLDADGNFCDTPPGNIYSGNNSGTPGIANQRCTADVPSGTCLDNGVPRAVTSPQAGDLVITEVMASPSATADSTGEWFEVLARTAVDLNGVNISTTSSSTRIDSDQCLRVQPGQYVLLARSSDAFLNGGLPMPFHVYESLSFADTTNQRFSLSRGDAGIDEIGLLPSTSGKAWQLDPLKLDPGSNDDTANFCRAPNKWNADGGGDYGSPGAVNAACPVPDAGQMVEPESCIDSSTLAARAIRYPTENDLVITEWHSSPAATTAANGEFIEVLAKNNFDLNGVSLRIGTSKTALSSPNCLSVTANSYLLFGRNGDPLQNGHLPSLTASFSAALTGTSSISLLGVDGGVFDSVTATREFSGASIQVDPSALSASANDLETNRCRSLRKWNIDGGGDFGSPGAANPPCPDADGGVVDPQQCFDTGTMALRPISFPPAGQLVITEWMSDPGSVTDAVGEYFEVLAKGAFDLNGLTLRVGTSNTSIASSTCRPVTANSYLVFGKNGDALVNGNLPALTGIFGGSLTASSVITVLGVDGGVHDAVTANDETAGASMQIKPGFENPTDNDVLANRCTTPTTSRYGPLSADGGITGNRGTPGLPNVACP